MYESVYMSQFVPPSRSTAVTFFTAKPTFIFESLVFDRSEDIMVPPIYE